MLLNHFDYLNTPGNGAVAAQIVKLQKVAASDYYEYVDSSHYYLMRYNHSAGKLQIVKVKNGTEQMLSETSFNWVLGTVYQVKGVFGSNGKLDFHIWGGTLPKVTATDTKFASGKAGYYGSLADVKFDDFLITNR